MENRRASRWLFVGILLDGSEVELKGFPFISANEEAIRKEAVRRSLEYDRAAPGNWIMDVRIEAC